MFWAAAAVSVASSLAGAGKARKARKARAAAAQYQKKQNALVQYQKSREFMKQFRQAQAMQYTAANAMGIDLESSVIQGELQSQKGQVGTAFFELDMQTLYANRQQQYLDRAAKYDYQSQMAGVIGNFASQFMAGGPGGKPSTPDGTN